MLKTIGSSNRNNGFFSLEDKTLCLFENVIVLLIEVLRFRYSGIMQMRARKISVYVTKAIEKVEQTEV